MSRSVSPEPQWREAQARLTGEDHAWVSVPEDAEDAMAVLVVEPERAARLAVAPVEGVLSEAPMGDYDVLELSVFAHAVARVRWFEEDGIGAIGAVTRVGDSDLPDDEVIPVLVEAALDEAWQEGASLVSTVAPTRVMGAYLRAGWRLVETVAPQA